MTSVVELPAAVNDYLLDFACFVRFDLLFYFLYLLTNDPLTELLALLFV